ncbi:AraC family transcriptional regulator ligand-binding domain-containing protein [Acinetobacter sp.]|uniref:AraC family transcriptional regulator n=1 Tax=Acinetobacter sp. TaxID=472 RepID=UPI002819F392|nr:AraC family transcriptional regulator ligand-binding domain-containing protein [Acinetobacter sp.]MDR2248540.1 AraC family transcriptional regulator [Acinetobacter sp.]
MKVSFNTNGKVRIGLINHILDNCDSFNITREELIEKINLNENLLIDPNSFLSFQYLEKIILFLFSNSDDPLKLIKFIDKNNSIANGVLGYLIEISSTLQEAIETFEKYWELNGKIGKVFLIEKEEFISLEWVCLLGSPKFIKYATEYKIAWWTSIVQLVKSNEQTILHSIHFQHDVLKPEHVEFYENFFKCPVYFNQPKSAIVLSKNALNLPLKTANRRLYESIENYAKLIVKESIESNEFTSKVRSILYEQLYIGGNFSRDYIASKLGVSERTLSRKLLEEQSKYSDILDEIRFDLAKNYLRNKDFKISIISKSLGFYTSTAFITWFKSKTGSTPNKFRETHKEKCLLNSINN